MKDANEPWRDAILAEYFLEKVAPRVPDWQVVRTDRFKYIHYAESDNLDELYHLQIDAKEMKNLVWDDDNQSPLNELKSRLQELLREAT